MVDMVKKFLKYREQLSILVHYAAKYDGVKARKAYKIIDLWKEGKISFNEALRRVKSLSRRKTRQ